MFGRLDIMVNNAGIMDEYDPVRMTTINLVWRVLICVCVHVCVRMQVLTCMHASVCMCITHMKAKNGVVMLFFCKVFYF